MRATHSLQIHTTAIVIGVAIRLLVPQGIHMVVLEGLLGFVHGRLRITMRGQGEGRAPHVDPAPDPPG